MSALLSHIFKAQLATSTVNTSFTALNKIKNNLKKRSADADKLAAFLAQPYSVPAPRGKRKPFTQPEVEVTEITTPEPKSVRIIDPFEQVSKELGKENSDMKILIDSQRKNLRQLQSDFEKLKQRYAALEKTLANSQTKLKNAYRLMGKFDKPKHITQSMKRKNTQVKHWKQKAEEWRKVVIKLKQSDKRCKSKTETLTKLQTQNANKKCRAKKGKSIPKTPTVDTALLQTTLVNAVDIIQTKNNHIDFIEDRLVTAEDKVQSTNTILLRDPDNPRKINPSFKHASMILQGIGVAEHEVGPSIEAVISTMTESKLEGAMPSRSSQQTLASEMHAISLLHMREQLKGEKDVTLKYDATSKYGRHIVEVEIETEDRTYFAGGREVPGGKAKDYVECLVDVACDVDSNMLEKVSNTMTDRCVTNNAVDRGLGEVKGGKVNSFRCATHPLDTIHKSCDKFVKAHELTLEFPEGKQLPYQKGGESKTQATLRCVDKLFHDSGCGLPKELPHYLKSRGIKGGENTVLYPRWVGNRFNIYFVNAGLYYMYDGLIKEFQTNVIKPRNQLHHAIYNMSLPGTLRPILRALGIVSKYVTGPWMRWQGTRQGILETSKVFTKVLDTLDGVNPITLVNGFETTAFDDEPKHDAVYSSLTTSTKEDDETAKILGGLLHETAEVMRRQLVDHLPGGVYHNPDEVLIQQAKSCSSNNISGERVFARIDSRMSKARSASITKAINKTQWKLNKVPAFLAGKSKEERIKIIRDAETEAPKHRQKDKERKEELRKAIRARLDDSRRELEARAQHSRESREKIIETVMEVGIWNTEEEINTGLVPLKKTKAITVLKSQIRFRTDILGCVYPHKILYTKATQENLKDHLKKILQTPIPEDKQEIIEMVIDPSVIVNFNVNQKWVKDGIDTMCRGTIVGFVCTDENHPGEYECSFENEESHFFQTVSEVVTDVVVGDMFLHVS